MQPIELPTNTAKPRWRIAFHISAITVLSFSLPLLGDPNIQIVALRGERAAGLAPKELLSNWSASAGINQQGLVAFIGEISRAALTGYLVEAGRAIWIGTPNNLELVVREGQPAAGFPDPMVFHKLYEYFALNNRGEVVFLASIGLAGSEAESIGLFVGTPGNLRLVAKNGDPAIGFEAFQGELEFADISEPIDPPQFALTDDGTVIWAATVSDSNQTGVWKSTTSETRLLSQIDDNPIAGRIENLTASSDGVVAFSSHQISDGGSSSSLFLWDGTNLNALISSGDTIEDESLVVREFERIVATDNGTLVLKLLVQREGERNRQESLWRRDDGQFQLIHLAGTEVLPDFMRSRSIHLIPNVSSTHVAYETCSSHITSQSLVCVPILHVAHDQENHPVAYWEMPNPVEPQMGTVVFHGFSGLRERTVLTNNRGTILTHFGIMNDNGETTQAIYQFDGSNYDPILQRGDQVNIDSDTPSTVSYFSLLSDSQTPIPIRTLNDRDQFLLTINTRERPRALALLSIDPVPIDIHLARRNGSLHLSWEGDGVLEQSGQVTGPWAASPDQSKEQVLPQSSPQRFFRVTH